MDINKKKWYVEWYFTCLAIIDEFVEERDVRVHRYRKNTGLCSFMRVSMLWGPAIILLHIAFYAAVIASVTFLPIYLFGFGGYGKVIGALVLAIFAIWLFNFVWNEVAAWRYRKRVETRANEPEESNEPQVQAAEPVDKGPSFASLVWSYAVAVKQKVCPTINFNN